MPTQLLLDANEQMQSIKAALTAEMDLAQGLYVRSVFAEASTDKHPSLNGRKLGLDRSLFALETIGFDLNHRARTGNISALRQPAWHELVWPAYRIRRILSRAEVAGQVEDAIDLAFNEALDGVVANRQPELRLHLAEIDLNTQSPVALRWDRFVEREVKRAFLLIVRKKDGHADIMSALQVIADLRRLQPEREGPLAGISKDEDRQIAARVTLAMYNCAKAVELTAQFTIGQATSRGEQRLSAEGVQIETDLFVFNARELLCSIDHTRRILIGRLGQACRALVDSSVYAQTLPTFVRRFMKQVATRKDKPILELWHAQREALNKQLLDPTRSAIVISLPTSSGKTLLAEMAIAQAFADAPQSHIVYLAPTRALVTQVSLTLRRDLGPLEMSVRVATPAFELDPVEDAVLRGNYNVLVTTPEKLDLLLKTNHPSVEDLSLVIVDEAHVLAEEERGARLELLLATLRRERTDCRFILLTPFAKNAADLAHWLGADRSAPVVIDWKPNDRVIGAFMPRNKRGVHELFFETLASAHSDCPPGIAVDVVRLPQRLTKKRDMAIAAAMHWASKKNGGVLLLASSRNGAAECATEIAARTSQQTSQPAIDLVARFLDTETGAEHPLSPLLRKGVAFHHAGLSSEARYFVERLVEDGQIQMLCATTTLAHGVHFPLSAVIIEGYVRRYQHRGRWHTENIKPWEMWNIVGRAGRALEDSLGSVGFIANSRGEVRKIQDFLKQDAGTVVSALAGMIQALQNRSVSFDLNQVGANQAFSAFLQYVLHAVSVAGYETARRNIAALLRASFAYAEIERQNPALADTFMRIATQYLDFLLERKGDSLAGFVKIADGTGFSSPSVDLLWGEWRTGYRLRMEDWRADTLFSRQAPSNVLVNIMNTLGRVPEVHLGNRETGPFNPERIARIAAAWVGGESIIEIARREYGGDILGCSHHLYGTLTGLVSWGIQAIERVVFAGVETENQDDIQLLPAMVLHGVRSKHAVGLCMLNVPRLAAEGLGQTALKNGVALTGIETWIRQADEKTWQQSLPRDARISGAECRLLWQVIDGQREWADLNLPKA